MSLEKKASSVKSKLSRSKESQQQTSARKGNRSGEIIPSPSNSSLQAKRQDASEEFFKAKAFLMHSSTVTNMNMYDHLSELVGEIIDGRPENVVDYFEDLSLWIKKSKLQYKDDALLDKEDTMPRIVQARKERRLYQVMPDDVEGGEEEEQFESLEDDLVPNLLEQIYFFEQGGIQISREELIRIMLSMKSLAKGYPLQTIRFWGKIIGTERNYIIAETEYKVGEMLEEEEEEELGEEEGEEDIENDDGKTVDDDNEEDEGGQLETEDSRMTPLPKPKIKPPVVIPTEPFRTGVNKKIYFFCNEPGQSWIRLPLATPAHITAARTIRRYFTGRPEAVVLSYPPFPGKEIHYLRAQISRISAATLISPMGFFQFGDEEEEDEARGRENFVANEEFEPIPVKDLVDPNMDNWVHHSLHILPQGRCSWFNPKIQHKRDDEEEEEEGDEEDEEFEPEVGPPLLTPLSEDMGPENITPWTTRTSSNAFPHLALAVIHSNIWPGAHAFALQKRFANLYVGYGVKTNVTTYTPPPAPSVMSEYPLGPNVMEVRDPTPEEEAAYQAAQAEAEIEDADVEDENEGDAQEED